MSLIFQFSPSRVKRRTCFRRAGKSTLGFPISSGPDCVPRNCIISCPLCSAVCAFATFDHRPRTRLSATQNHYYCAVKVKNWHSTKSFRSVDNITFIYKNIIGTVLQRRLLLYCALLRTMLYLFKLNILALIA